MSNRMDQLFKKKLSDYALIPSADAWSKIETGLSKKNKFVIFWRAAAAFILCGLLVGSWVYFQSKDENQTKQLAIENKKGETVIEDSSMKPKSTENLAEKESNSQSATVKKQEVVVQKKNLNTNKPQLAIIESKPAADINPKEKETEILEVIELKSNTTAAVKTEKPIVIEFTLDAIPSNQTAVAKVDEIEKNQLKRIWDKALDIKNGETELGGLRLAKNELFALDFKRDKTKRN